jgi:chemotaxis protein methyltransferase CheR
MRPQMSALPKSAPQALLTPGEFALTARDFDDIAAMIFRDAGIDLQVAKAPLVYSRLAKRLRLLNLANFREYCDLVASPAGAAERHKMLSALTTNVTRFFREPHHFDHLRDVVLPKLLAGARSGGKIRIWSSACSSGEEPYSVALILLGLEAKAAELDIKVLATDIDPEIVARAQAGRYPEAALADVPEHLRRRHFRTAAGGAREELEASDEVRALISFRRLNLHSEWPMKGAFHAIYCRNVAIYFDEPTQQSLWSRFATKLEPGGHLYIGHSERVSGPAANKFTSAGITTYRLVSGGKA